VEGGGGGGVKRQSRKIEEGGEEIEDYLIIDDEVGEDNEGDGAPVDRLSDVSDKDSSKFCVISHPTPTTSGLAIGI
jgi:hypothetical protein